MSEAVAPRRSEIEAFVDGLVRDPAFLERYPYYAAVLARLVPVADPSVARMAVSLEGGRFYLHVNVDAFVAEPAYLRGVLLHEVHHVALGHLAHPKFADPLDPELMELAMEMSANEHVEEPLPSPITWRAFSSLGMRAGQSTLDRYHRLREALAGAPRPVPRGGGEIVDDHRRLAAPTRDPGGVEHTRRLLEEARTEADSNREEGDDDPRWRLAGKDPGRLVEELTGVRAAPEVPLD